MIGKARVPPDAGVNPFGKILPVLVGAGLLVGTVLVHCVGARNHHFGSLALARMHIDGSFFCRSAGSRRALIENVHHIVAQPVQLRLGEKRKQVLISPVAIDDDDLLASVSCHFVGRLLQ